MDLAAAFASQELPRLLEVFLLIMCRVGAMLLAAPAFSEHGVPAWSRLALASLVAFLLLPCTTPNAAATAGWLALGLAAVGEVLLGIFCGFLLQMGFEALLIGFRVVETQAGFSLGASIMPGGMGHAPLSNLYRSLALVLFFVSGSYRLALRAVAASFHQIPVGAALSDGCAWLTMSRLLLSGSHMMAAALSLAAPLIGAILLADAALGLLSRAAPQMNIFAVGFPVKVSVALIMTLVTLPVFAATFTRELHRILAGLFILGGRL